jgi:hypothetical protein
VNVHVKQRERRAFEAEAEFDRDDFTDQWKA